MSDLKRVMRTGIVLDDGKAHMSLAAFNRMTRFERQLMRERMMAATAADTAFRGVAEAKEAERKKAMAPGVASAMGKLMEIQRETRDRNIARQEASMAREAAAAAETRARGRWAGAASEARRKAVEEESAEHRRRVERAYDEERESRRARLAAEEMARGILTKAEMEEWMALTPEKRAELMALDDRLKKSGMFRRIGPKVPPGFVEPVVRARDASEEREAAGVARSRSGSPIRAPTVGGAGTAEPEKPVLPVADLPEEVQKDIREMVGPDDRFNLAKTFTSGKAVFRARANTILLALAAFAEDGPDGKLYVRAPTGYQGEARDVANELPALRDLVGSTRSYGKFVESFPIVEPTREQLDMLIKGLKYTEFYVSRGKAGMMGPVSIKVEWRVKSSDLNLKTKAGRAELAARKAEDTATALDYLKRAARPDFMAYLDTLEGRRKAKIAETKAVAKAVFSIPATEAKAEYVSPDNFEDVYLAFYGDADRAKAAAANLRRRIPGKRAKFFGRKNLNIRAEP